MVAASTRSLSEALTTTANREALVNFSRFEATPIAHNPGKGPVVTRTCQKNNPPFSSSVLPTSWTWCRCKCVMARSLLLQCRMSHNKDGEFLHNACDLLLHLIASSCSPSNITNSTAIASSRDGGGAGADLSRTIPSAATASASCGETRGSLKGDVSCHELPRQR